MKENNNNANNQFDLKEPNHNQKNSAQKTCRYQSFFKSKLFIAIAFAIFGFASATLAHNVGKSNNANAAQSFKEWSENFDQTMQSQRQQVLNAFNQDPFFANNNVFQEMELMEKNMDDMFALHRQHIKKIFDAAKNGNITTNKTAVSSYEYGTNYYYDLTFSGFKKEDIKVEIKDNNLSFSAWYDQNQDNKNQKIKSSNNFYYSFSLPPYNSKIAPEIIKQDGKITVKFTKNITKKDTIPNPKSIDPF